MKKLSQALAFGLIISLVSLNSFGAAIGEDCDAYLDYGAAVTELAQGYITIEKMKFDGATSQAVIISFEYELENHRSKLIKILGQSRFDEIFNSALSSRSDAVAREEGIKVETRKDAVEEQSGAWQPWSSLFDLKGHEHNVSVLDYSPNGQFIVTGSHDGTAKVWNSQTGELFKTLNIPKKHVCESVQFSPDGEKILIGARDGFVRLWSFKIEDTALEIPVANAIISRAQFSRDGQYFATASSDQVLRIWDVKTLKPIKSFDKQSEPIVSLDFSADSKSILVGYTNGILKSLDLKSKAKNRDYIIPLLKELHSASYSPDGKLIVLASGGSVGIIVDAVTGEIIHRLNGHSGIVTSARFSPNGRLVATTSLDGSIRIWTVNTGQELFVLSEHENAVYTVMFHPNGHELVSGAGDNLGIVWKQSTLDIE